MTKFPELPETQVASLREPPELAQDIFDMICSGWSPARISRHLYKTQELTIPTRDIKEFLEEIPTVYFLPTPRLRERLLKLDVRIDALGDLARLIRIGEERLSAALLTEEQNPQAMTSKVSQLMREQYKMLLQFAKLQQEVGELPTEPLQLDIKAHLDKLPTIGDILKESNAP